MKMVLMQPTFNPWLGYFDLIDYADKFVFLDTVKLNHQSWQTRNKIKIQNTEYLFSIPIQKVKGKKDMFINEVMIDFRKFDFRKKFIRTLEQNYKKSEFFDETIDFIKEIVLFETNYLSIYNINIIKKISQKIGIKTDILILSDTSYRATLNKGELVFDICKYFETTEYVSPLGAKDYLEEYHNIFFRNSVGISYQQYIHPYYRQFGDDFIPYLGIFDLLFNVGFENSLSIIRSGRKYEDVIDSTNY
jgi:hypothetical protein